MSTTTLRNPAVAGRFYPGDPGELRTQLHSFLSPSAAEPVRALGCIAPHAGYMYSGHVAGALFARIEIPRCCIVLCPNHTGQGQALAMMGAGAWKTPLGDVPIDEALARAVQRQFPLLHDDFAAHRSEHAAEVELPFLQLRQPQLRFLPIALGTSRFETLEHLGKALAAVISEQDHRVLMVASSDMNHYESDAVTRVKDHRALEPILALDPRGLYDVITEHDISMCGFGPAVAMLTAARELGATAAELVKYATSGDVSGDRDLVVGYAGLLVK